MFDYQCCVRSSHHITCHSQWWRIQTTRLTSVVTSSLRLCGICINCVCVTERKKGGETRQMVFYRQVIVYSDWDMIPLHCGRDLASWSGWCLGITAACVKNNHLSFSLYVCLSAYPPSPSFCIPGCISISLDILILYISLSSTFFVSVSLYF